VIPLKTAAEVDAIGRAGAIIGRLFEQAPARIVPGSTTAELDGFVEEFIRGHDGAVPAFKGLYGFPASACISVNHEVVHGIPSQTRVLAEGDLVSLDVGVLLDGWYADSARTFGVGAIDDEAQRLLEVTEESLREGIAQAVAGRRLGDVGAAIQRVAEQAGYGVVRDLVGHGIGRSPHEEPQVPNFGKPGRGLMLRPGMTLAIEPMINEGSAEVRTLSDRWTVVTVDRSRSAHFEHTIAIEESGPPRILTLA
jgi:methionyl aminopeptidase